MPAQYKIYNGAAPTTAKFVAVTTGTNIKTMLQVAPIKKTFIRAWGVSMDGAAVAASVPWELIETGTVFGTVSAHVAAGIQDFNDVTNNPAPSEYFTLSTTTTGYTCTSEGTITESRLLDTQLIQPIGQFAWEFSDDNMPHVQAGYCLRVRCHAAAAVNAICWVLLEPASINV